MIDLYDSLFEQLQTSYIFIHYLEKTTGVNVNGLAHGGSLLGGDFVLGGTGTGLGAFSFTRLVIDLSYSYRTYNVQ
ncbi:unnamed protein product [Rotaria sp. Silwood1]|nr:unnamed protein product [Rotaria sp. Silwood1]CAF1685368.1 unnamed protein product [Rotaria sp. Silwood1]CAF3795669.1 unnamed protein product [Rotaria sp. Silwood1]CAF3894221.1 unnamed protein product [Rotaria sp. Silwood1]CAF4911579.1 unnamed protein product [Rotaria sp. Silwood1]